MLIVNKKVLKICNDIPLTTFYPSLLFFAKIHKANVYPRSSLYVRMSHSVDILGLLLILLFSVCRRSVSYEIRRTTCNVVVALLTKLYSPL